MLSQITLLNYLDRLGVQLVLHGIFALLLGVEFGGFLLKISPLAGSLNRRTLGAVKLGLGRVDEVQNGQAYESETQAKPEDHVVVAVCLLDDGGSNEWADEARCLADCVEQGVKEEQL